MKQELQELISVIQESENIVFFGGAGVSTESNIPKSLRKEMPTLWEVLLPGTARR